MTPIPSLRSLVAAILLQFPVLTTTASAQAPPQFQEVTCEGVYPLHLQGVATDGAALYWSWTDALVKTDLQGRLLKKIPADNHHGDLCTAQGKVFVAVNLGKFNRPAGEAKSWVYAYDASSLELMGKHPTPELVHGAGGIAEHDGKFLVVGGLPPEGAENYLYEYNPEFRFVRRHVLASGHTDKGIQTATWSNGSWWFGCYGAPQVLLRADAEMKLTGRWDFSAALGLEALPDGRFLLGRDTASKGKGHTWRVIFASEDALQGLALAKP